MFLGLEHATVIWETPSSSIASFSVASTMDLTRFFGHVIVVVFHVDEQPVGAAQDVLWGGAGGGRGKAVRQEKFSL